MTTNQAPDQAAAVAEKPKQPQYAGVKLTLENCLLTPEELADSPSQKEGITAEEEECLRCLGCEFLQNAGNSLQVPQTAIANSQVLFQRFYCIKSFVKNKIDEVAMACIFVASKIEEAPRRVRDVINVFHMVKQKLEDPKCTPTMMKLDENYTALKHRVIKYERRVLKELGFAVHVEHPHKIIIMFFRVLNMADDENLVQTAWNFMNDAMRTTLFVEYSPVTIAGACIELALRVHSIGFPHNPHWVCMLGMEPETIESIAKKIQHTYYICHKIKYEMAYTIVDRIKQANSEKESATDTPKTMTSPQDKSPIAVQSAINSPVTAPNPIETDNRDGENGNNTNEATKKADQSPAEAAVVSSKDTGKHQEDRGSRSHHRHHHHRSDRDRNRHSRSRSGRHESSSKRKHSRRHRDRGDEKKSRR